MVADTQFVFFEFYINPCFSTSETTLTIDNFHLPLDQQRQDITVSSRTDKLINFASTLASTGLSARSRLMSTFICSAQVSLMTSDGNTQIEKFSASLVKTVTSEDPPNVVLICQVSCVPRIESYTGYVTLVVSLSLQQL